MIVKRYCYECGAFRLATGFQPIGGRGRRRACADCAKRIRQIRKLRRAA